MTGCFMCTSDVTDILIGHMHRSEVQVLSDELEVSSDDSIGSACEVVENKNSMRATPRNPTYVTKTTLYCTYTVSMLF